MKLQVAEELRTPGKTGVFSMAYPWTDTEYGGRIVSFSAPPSVKGTYVFDGTGFTVEGTLSGLLRSECARCTKAFDEPFSFDFSERFEKTGSEDDGVYAFANEVLDLATMLRDNVFLHLPLLSVCSEDCKGLCPVCGCDRNIVRCSCVQEEPEQKPNRPLQALGALLKEDKEV